MLDYLRIIQFSVHVISICLTGFDYAFVVGGHNHGFPGSCRAVLCSMIFPMTLLLTKTAIGTLAWQRYSFSKTWIGYYATSSFVFEISELIRCISTLFAFFSWTRLVVAIVFHAIGLHCTRILFCRYIC